MNITYFHYCYGQDGPSHHVRQFAEAVKSLGHSISVHAMNLAPTENGSTRNRVRNTLKGMLSPYLHELKELAWNPRYILRESAIVRAEQPDVLLTRHHFLTASCLVVAKQTGKPLVLEVNAPACESATYFDEYFHIPFVGEYLERLTVQGAAQVVVVSDALRSHIAKHHDVHTEKLTVSHNGVDCDKFHPGISGSAVRDRFGLQGKKVIGFVGSLYRWRGPDLLIEIAKRLAQDQTTAFLLVGDGDEWKVFRDQLLSLKLQNSVVFAGRVDHEVLPQFLAAMDVALLPDSTFYMSPLKLFEYMAAGIPTVAPRYDAIEEIISHGETGLLFRPADPESATRCITLLLNDPEKRKEMGLAAVRHVTKNFTWRANAERVISACQRALGEKSKTEG